MPFLDVSRLGTPYPTMKEHEVRFNCPFCDDSKMHLYVNTKKKVWQCFKCGSTGKTNMVVAEMNQLHLAHIEKHERQSEIVPVKLPPAYKDIYTPSAKKYLASRKVYESDCRTHRIYCAAPNTIYFGRLIIPCNARGGYCSYFVARAYTKIRFPKYLNPPNPRNTLFISPERSEFETKWSMLWDENELMIVEGPFDYIKSSRHGPTVALLGKQMSYEQAKLIVSSYEKVWIMLDQGNAESLAAIKIRDMLSPHIDVEILRCPKKDPGEMNPEDFEELMK